MPFVAPPGWPREVPPPDAPGWEQRASGWLFDLLPGEYRQYDVLRRYPVLLARFAADHVAGTLEAARLGWRTLRADTSGRGSGVEVPAHAVTAAMQAYEREGARMAVLQREVAMVREALEGRRWVDRL